MPRPPVKKTEKLAKATELGILRARRQFERSKTLPIKFKEYVDKLLVNTSAVDVLEIAAVFSLTPLIEPQLEKLVLVGTIDTGVIANFLKIWGFPILGLPTTGPTTQEELDKLVPGGKIAFWLLAFVVSFIIVKYGGQLAIAGMKNLTGIVGALGFGAAEA